MTQKQKKFFCNNCGNEMDWNTVNLCEKCATELFCRNGCGNKAPYKYARCNQCQRKWNSGLKKIGEFLVNNRYLKEELQ